MSSQNNYSSNHVLSTAMDYAAIIYSDPIVAKNSINSANTNLLYSVAFSLSVCLQGRPLTQTEETAVIAQITNSFSLALPPAYIEMFLVAYTKLSTSQDICVEMCNLLHSSHPTLYKQIRFYSSQLQNMVPATETQSILARTNAPPVQYVAPNQNMGYAPPPIYQRPVYAPPVYQQPAYGYRSIHNPYFGVSGGGKFGFYSLCFLVLWLINLAFSSIEYISYFSLILYIALMSAHLLFLSATFRQSWLMLFSTNKDDRPAPYNNTGGFIASVFLALRIISLLRTAVNLFGFAITPSAVQPFFLILFIAMLAGIIFYKQVGKVSDKIFIYPAYAICESFLKH